MSSPKGSRLLVLLAVFFLMAILPMTSAAIESLGTFEHNECINLIQTCSDCTYNNITSVIYPDSTQALGQVIMTQTGTVYNYSFCNTTILGTYLVNGIGDSSGDTDWNYDFEVTPTGETANEYPTILYLLILCAIIMFLGIHWEVYPLTLLGGLASLPISLNIINNGINNVSNQMTTIFGIISLGIAAFVTAVAGIKFIQYTYND